MDGDVPAAAAELFPSFVAVVGGPIKDTDDRVYPDELAAVARAVPSRVREFLSGRAYAHRALERLELDDAPIGMGARREPLWPTGAVGSIAHAGHWSVAVVARASDARALGVDLEVLDPPLGDDVDRLVRTPLERDLVAPAGHPLAPHVGKLSFSVKETVYKAMFPITGWVLEFDDVNVTLDLDGGTWTATLAEGFDLTRHGLGPLEGGFRMAGDYVVTGLYIASTAAGANR